MQIGPYNIQPNVVLAPMAGVTDKPFRLLCKRLGAGLAASEMTISDPRFWNTRKSIHRMDHAGEPDPISVQIAGTEPQQLAEAARYNVDHGAQIIDINMGCPAKKVTTGYSGSALMRDLDHALTLIDATVSATDLPVTLKMRLGWDDRTRNAADLARHAEAAGVRLVTVHGRTRCQFYSGAADWAAIRAVKDSVSIPVIANGDLASVNDLAPMLAASGADGLMIGRGAYGRPWLPGHLATFAATGVMPEPPAGAALHNLVREHYLAGLDHYGPILGIRTARKHLAWYLDHASLQRKDGDALRRAVLTENRPKDVLRLLGAWFDEPAERSAA